MGIKKIIGMLAGAVILTIGFIGISHFAKGSMTNESPKMEVSFLKVGKADSIIFQEGDHTMVIDAGEEDDGEEIVEWLKKRKVLSVETLIITHFDKDHVGGADILVEDMEVEKVILPDYVGQSTEYQDFMVALEEKNIIPEFLTENKTFTFGTAEVLIEPSRSYKIPENVLEYDNNFSLITTVTHGENKMLFTGDIEKQRINSWLNRNAAQECQFIKIPHHGVYNRSLARLLNVVNPKYAVICSSEKNPAESKTLELLKALNIKTWETKMGNITLTSDGKELQISQ